MSNRRWILLIALVLSGRPLAADLPDAAPPRGARVQALVANVH